MKITIDVDVTPRELRVFFGLPDVKPIQDEMLDKIREQMKAGAEGLDPMSLMKTFMPQGVQSVEALQKVFWDALLSGKKTSVSDELDPKKGAKPKPGPKAESPKD